MEADYQSDWFYLPYHLKRSNWSDLYFDDSVQEMMITYSAPVLEQGEVVAVITCDLSLEQILNVFEKLPLSGSTRATLMNRFGRILAHPNPDWVMKETLFSLGEAMPDPEQKATMAHLLELVRAGEPGTLFGQRTITGDRAWIYCQPIPSASWSIAFIVPEREVFAPIRAMNRKMLWIALTGLILLLIPALLVSLTMTRPLHALCEAAEDLSGGHFDTPLPRSKRSDEIGRMVSSFERMRIELKEYIADLAQTTTAKEKIESELSIACEIQHSILPKLFPPFPKRAGLDIFAALESAREVGGDLYDFMLLDDDHLYFCIGDVSGKGVPASLFMAVGKTLLKSTIQTLRDPAQALAHVNNELADGNDTCMFITLFCGILNLKTNELIYANAGHNPPVSMKTNGFPTFLPPSQSPPLGALEDMIYSNETLQLDEAEQLLLYTDGVTEAMNPQQELFGEERLIQLLTETRSRTAEKCISLIQEALRKHADGAEQSDDITMLTLSHTHQSPANAHDKSPSATLVLTNHRAELARMVNWLEDLSTKLKWPDELLMKLNLTLEEWIVNVISYAFPNGGLHEIELRLWQSAEAVKIEVRDDGIAFDPTAQRAPDLTIPIEEREIGGLGIHFIQNTMDTFTYERDGAENIVCFTKHLNQE